MYYHVRMEQVENLVIVDQFGDSIQKTQDHEKSITGDLDPNFMKSWWQLFGGAGSSSVSAITKQPYAKHPWVYACGSAISTNIGRLKTILYNINKPDQFIRQHPLISLIKRPNFMMNGAEFYEAIMLNLLLPTSRTPGGQCFIVPLDASGEKMSLGKGKLPTFLFPFSDEQLKAKKQNGVFLYWEYKHPSGEEIKFYPDELIRIRLFNPYDWTLGLSPYSAAQITVVADAKASELADKFMDNSANIGGILKTDSKLNSRQAEDLKKMWMEQYEGWAKAGKTALLHSGLEFEQTARSLVDLQFKDLRTMSMDTILAVYGVPKTVLGLTGSVNRSTAKVEKEIFWEDTLLPYIDKLWSGLNTQFINVFDPTLEGYFDLTNVQPLKKDVSAKVKDAHTMIQDGVKATEAYRIVALPVNSVDQPWLDQPLVIKARVNLATGETIGAAAPKEPSKEEELVITKDVYDNIWESYIDNSITGTAKRLKSAIVKYYVSQRNSLQDKADIWLRDQKDKNGYIKNVPDINSLLFDVKDELVDLIKRTNNIYQDTILEQVIQIKAELQELKKFKLNSDVSKDIKMERVFYLNSINVTSIKRLISTIDNFIACAKKDTWTPAKLVREIKTFESRYYNARINDAKDIALTETTGVANRVRHDVLSSEGFSKWMWYTSLGEKSRKQHHAEHGSVVEIGKAFPVTGLVWPVYPKAMLSKIEGCTCFTLPVKD